MQNNSNGNSMRGVRQRPTKKQIVIMPALQSAEEMKNNLNAASSDWIPYTKLEFTKLLGSGAAGQVYKGLYDDKDAAIKVFETKFQEFEQEYKIFTSVSGPNIVTFYGACIEPRVCLVMEFCARGSLYDVLNSAHTHVGWKEILGFGIQMVRGLQTLHSNKPQILHRDVKSMNFLVDRNWVVKGNLDDQIWYV
jgi:serine/threonine protein kinase